MTQSPVTTTQLTTLHVDLVDGTICVRLGCDRFAFPMTTRSVGQLLTNWFYCCEEDITDIQLFSIGISVPSRAYTVISTSLRSAIEETFR